METKINMNLPAKLAFLRKQKGLTQMELAEYLNVSRQAISRWEGGYAVPSTDNLKILSDLYSVPVDYLLNDDAAKIAWSPSNQEVMSKGQKEKARSKKHWTVLIYLVILLLTIAVAAAVSYDQDTEQIAPIEDMASEKIEDYTTNTFRLE